jgi:predicted metal-dependent peptidase
MSKATKVIDPATKKAAEDRMGASKARLLLQQPFYGVLLSMTDFIQEDSIPTMATDGTKVFYNPAFTMEIADDEVFGVLLHEISHCIYLHCTQKRRMNRAHHRWNVATDYAINLEIKNMGYKLPSGLLLDDKYRDLAAEQIYDKLPEDCSNKQTFDIHIENTDSSEWDDMEDKIVTAYEMTKDAKSKGDIPAGIKRWIDKIRKSKVNWARVFHNYIGQAVAKDDYSYTRVNKRFLGQDIYLPDLRSHTLGRVVVAIDTSGSIDKEQLQQFAAEIHKIGGLIEELTILSADCQVHEIIKVSRFQNFMNKLKFLGGGGTSHKVVFDKIKEMHMEPEILVCLTDMMSDIEQCKKPNYPVLWVSTSEIDKAPFGKVVQIPKGSGGGY